MAVIFKLHNVTCRYPDATDPIFKNVTLEIPTGRVVAVLGRSGVGKSTFLYLLGLVWEASLESGMISYQRNGALEPENYARLSPGRRARLRRHDFGFVLQSSYLFSHLTCAENVALPMQIGGRSRGDALEAAQRLLKEVAAGSDLALRSNHYVGEFSGGEKRRISMLRGIAHDPSVLFADEPLSNLDLGSARAMVELLRCWHRGELTADAVEKPRTLLLVTHDVETAVELADRFIVFRADGTIVGDAVQDRAAVFKAGGAETLRRLIDSFPGEDDIPIPELDPKSAAVHRDG